MQDCTDEEYRRYLIEAPAFERLLVNDGILLFKYWLAVDQEKQEDRFAERAEDPRKRWKLSPVDLEARRLYREYGQARDAMFAATHRPEAPWVVVDFNDQRLGRLNLIRHLLEHTPDLQIPIEPIELPPLEGEPAIEQYTGPVRPIEGYY